MFSKQTTFSNFPFPGFSAIRSFARLFVRLPYLCAPGQSGRSLPGGRASRGLLPRVVVFLAPRVLAFPRPRPFEFAWRRCSSTLILSLRHVRDLVGFRQAPVSLWRVSAGARCGGDWLPWAWSMRFALGLSVGWWEGCRLASLARFPTPGASSPFTLYLGLAPRLCCLSCALVRLGPLGALPAFLAVRPPFSASCPFRPLGPFRLSALFRPLRQGQRSAVKCSAVGFSEAARHVYRYTPGPALCRVPPAVVV